MGRGDGRLSRHTCARQRAHEAGRGGHEEPRKCTHAHAHAMQDSPLYRARSFSPTLKSMLRMLVTAVSLAASAFSRCAAAA